MIACEEAQRQAQALSEFDFAEWLKTHIKTCEKCQSMHKDIKYERDRLRRKTK